MRIPFANGLSLQLLLDGGRFLGIGEVRCDALDLRSAALPWLVYAESETGVRFEDWTFTAIEEAGEARTIVARSPGRWMPRAQEADAMGDSRLRPRRLANGEATLRWTFRPLSEEIAGRAWRGLGMRIAIEAPGNPIHWLIEDATWELGGSATGSTLIQQDISTIDLEQEVARGSAFSTIEKFALDGGWGGAFPMDMLPRCAGSSPLDFQAKGGDALVLFSEKPSLTRTSSTTRIGRSSRSPSRSPRPSASCWCIAAVPPWRATNRATCGSTPSRRSAPASTGPTASPWRPRGRPPGPTCGTATSSASAPAGPAP